MTKTPKKSTRLGLDLSVLDFGHRPFLACIGPVSTLLYSITTSPFIIPIYLPPLTASLTQTTRIHHASTTVNEGTRHHQASVQT